MNNVLLLDCTYKVVNFIPGKRALKLLYKEKVTVLSTWSNMHLNWGSLKINYPSVLMLKEKVPNFINRRPNNFSRNDILIRDNLQCQYCEKKLQRSQITIDHVLPKYLGGKNTFTNCVVSCKSCNNKKANKTLEQSGLKLIKIPVNPTYNHLDYVKKPTDHWHEDWNFYLQ